MKRREGRTRAQKIDEAFTALLELDGPERRVALVRLARDAPEVAREVRRLLACVERSGSDFEDHLARLPLSVLGSLESRFRVREFERGDWIGPYQVVDTIGRGGWGTLHLVDPAPETGLTEPVALKVLRRGLDTDDVLRRFEAERRILESLAHPNIARLLDAGSTPDGRPYLVLTYVDGEPITTFCRSRRSPTDERLRLFLQLCDAVQYAHRRLVVHRDLKPGNVLVDRGGRARLLDFGIAKILSADDETVHQTRTGLRLFTPEFAAPEQILGEPATTATDVYQLTHLLYRLLTGRSPYPEHSESLARLQQIICSEPPVRPSAAAKRGEPNRGLPPAVPARRLQGDLDTILLKGLKKDPDERYPSVEALADDIRAHLRGLPVRARPDSTLYRVSRLIRRHPWPSAAAVFLVLVAAGWMTTVNRYAFELARERDHAQAQTRSAEEVTRFMTELLSAPGETGGDTISVRTVLQRGIDRAEARLPDDPSLRAGILSVMGQSLLSMGNADEAREVLERAVAIEGGFDEDPDGHAEALDRLASSYRQLQRPDDALRVQREGLEMIRETRGRTSMEYATAINHLGLTLSRAGDPEGAEAALREALEIHRELTRIRPDSHPPLRHASTLSNLGNLLVTRDRAQEALAHLEEAVGILEPHPDRDRVRALSLNVLGTARLRTGDLDGAEQAFRASSELRRNALGPDHPDLANSLHSLAGLLQGTERPDEAVPLYLESLRIREAAFGPHHPLVEHSLRGLGLAYRDLGRTDDAIAALTDLAERRRERLGPDHPETERTLALIDQIAYSP